MPQCATGLSVDRAIELLGSDRRRRLLRLLVEAEGPIERRELAAALQAEEERAAVESIEVVLAHHHLPKLDDAGVIEYDHRSGSVRPGEAVTAFEPLLAACEQFRG